MLVSICSTEVVIGYCEMCHFMLGFVSCDFTELRAEHGVLLWGTELSTRKPKGVSVSSHFDIFWLDAMHINFLQLNTYGTGTGLTNDYAAVVVWYDVSWSLENQMKQRR